LILTDNATDRHPSTQSADIRNNITCSSGVQALVSNADNRDGCFGRDAIDLAPNIAIKHEIADDEYAHLREAGKQGRDSARGNLLTRRSAIHSSPLVRDGK
jgi:hypothetical protein